MAIGGLISNRNFGSFIGSGTVFLLVICVCFFFFSFSSLVKMIIILFNINFYLLFAFECMGSYHFLLVWAGFVAAFLWNLGFVIGFIEIRYQSDGSGSGFFSLEIDFSVLLWSWISLSVEQSRAGLYGILGALWNWAEKLSCMWNFLERNLVYYWVLTFG